MSSVLPTLAVILAGAVAAGVVISRYPREESSWFIASFVAHVVAGLAQVAITEGLYGGGDLFGYTRVGGQLADALSLDFEGLAPEIGRLLFQGDPVLPVPISHPDSSTGSMFAIATILAYLTAPNPYTLCVVVAVMAFLGKLVMYGAFREIIAPHERVAAIVALLLMPSVVFWSSGLLKESVAIAGFGWVFIGTHRVMSKRIASGILPLALGALVVALVKPYILAAFVPAAGLWFFLRQSVVDGRVQLRPILALVFAGLGFAALLGLTALFPRFALENLADEAASLQEAGLSSVGGSNYVMGDGSARTIAGQMAFAPLALVSSLYRPFLFEASSLQVAINALETAVLLALTLRAFAVNGVAGTFGRIWQSPLLAHCLIFAAIFGTAVGLGTTNLGTLSRYRMPLVPFFAFALLSLAMRPPSASTPPQPAPERP
jgi:hypothetical protein